MRSATRRILLQLASAGVACISMPAVVNAEIGCAPGEAAKLDSLVNDIAALPEGGWLRSNLNRYDEVWTPRDLRPISAGIESTPSKIIQAWSSFAWDCRRGDLLIYGGGHANYSGNDTYRWRATTRRWERMSLPSDIRTDGMGNTTAIDGPFAAPPAAHTYDNNIYLPISDRMLVLGGSAWNNGGAFEMETGPNTERITGPYVFDLAKADGAKVGGTTGSHVKRVAPYPDILGGMMWQNRDLYALHPLSSLPSNHTSGTTAYVGGTNSDVVLFTARQGLGTAQHLFRYIVSDADDATSDSIARIGRYVSGVAGRGAGTYDPDLNLFVRNSIGSTGATYYYWDLSRSGADNPNVIFAPRDLSGTWSYDRGYGLDFDPVRGQYLLWGGTGDVWLLRAPATVSPNGWTIERMPSPTTTATPTSSYDGVSLESGGGVLGKWKYIPELDAFIGLQDTSAGNVWIYKPFGWVRPGDTPPPRLNISASQLQIFSGGNVNIMWRSSGASKCTADGDWSGEKPASGSQTMSGLVSNANFGLTCTGPGGSVRRNIAVTVDPIGPPTINPIATDACVNAVESNNEVTIDGTGKAGATVVLNIGALTRSGSVDALGSWRITLSSSNIRSIPDGVQTVTARQTSDQVAYSPSATISFTMDTVAPSSSTTAPALLSGSDTGSSNSDALTKDTTPTFQGSTGAASQPVVLLVDGAPAKSVMSGTAGKWSATTPTLAAGTHLVSAAVADKCLNLGPISSTSLVNVDTTAPSLVVNSIAGDNRINSQEAQQGVVIAGTTDSPSTVTLRISAGTVELFSRTTSSTGTWTVLLSASDVATLPDAALGFTVTVSDDAGNTRSSRRSVTKDTVIAAPTIYAVTGDDTLTAEERAGTITVTGRAEAKSVVTLNINNWTRQKTTSSAGDWSIDVPSSITSPLPSGSVTISVYANDPAGNTSSTSNRLLAVLGAN